MDLKNSIKQRLDIVLIDLLDKISDKYSIRLDELIKLGEGINFEEEIIAETNDKLICIHTMKSGKNKGKICGKKALENNYCSKHQTDISGAMERIIKNTNIEKKQIKQKETLDDLFNTAVAKDVTILRKHDLGLLHEDTDLIFDDNYTVIGKLNGNKIGKLSYEQVEICEKYAWAYDEDQIEKSDSESESESESE